MKEKTFAISVILVAFMAFGLVSIGFAAAKTPKVQIHIYLHPDVENADLQAGIIDVNDWPLAKEWVDAWALMPDQVVLRDYVELGMMEIDINNQMWPTGSESSKFYNPADSGNQSMRSAEFRKAVAYLLDRNAIVRDVLKGFGFRMDVPLPPFQSDFIDMPNYTASGLIYNYNVEKAKQVLDAAGFTVGVGGFRIDPLTGNKMDDIIFYIRQDDPNRRSAGEMLATELAGVGIPTKAIITERTVCYKNVMVIYNYNLYTGGWSLSTVPDQYHDFYASMTYYGPSIGWSQNYPGFCNHEYDTYALQVKYPETVADARANAKICGYLFLKYCAIVPMYCSKAVKAYRAGWTGVVNNAGFGVDNYFSFLNMAKPLDDTIDYGFKSDIEQLNQVSSEWLWDQNVLGLIYESMLGTNPFNLAPTEFFLANSYTVDTWAGPSGPATVVTFVLKENVTFHNTTVPMRKPLTAWDVKFSFDFQYACGPGIAWLYPNLANLNKTVVNSLYSVSIYYNKKSAWAFQWAGGCPILNNETWGLLTPGIAVKTYDPVTADINGDGVADIKEDGTGAWMFEDYATGSYVKLSRDDNYYLGDTNIADRLKEMFHIGAGDVDRSTDVNILDLGYLARSLGTFTGNCTHGTGWGDYNPDCDLNSDGMVNALDSAQVTTNYGKTMG